MLGGNEEQIAQNRSVDVGVETEPPSSEPTVETVRGSHDTLQFEQEQPTCIIYGGILMPETVMVRSQPST